MKNAYLLLIILVFLFSNYVSAQHAPEKFSHRIGIGVPFIPFIIGDFKIYKPAINISYKAGKNKNLLRSGISYWFNSYSYSSSINAGYERRFFSGKFQLIAGADLALKYYEETPFSLYRYKYSQFHIGAGPILGASYKPFKRVSFESECGITSGASKEKYNYFPKSRTQWGYYISTHRWFSIHVYYHLK